MAYRLRIAGAVSVLVLVAATAFAAWYSSDQAVQVVHYGAGEVSVLAVGNGTVTLTETAATGRPGVYWLEWTGSHTMLGDIVSRAPGRVTRRQVGGTTPSVGNSGYFGNAPPGDPKVAWGVDYSEIMVMTELGPAPAWYVPGDSDTWVIAVHGRNGRRKAELKPLPVVHRLGLPFLVISYRNDEGAPASPDGLLHLGDSEWRDLESAVRTAQRMGARRIVLYGTSMGGQLVGQFLDRSPLATAVHSVIMDSPVTEMVRAGRQGAAVHHMPSFMAWLADRVTGWRTGVDLERLDLLARPPKVRPPMLLIHTRDDEEMPVQAARDLAAAGRWPIQYEEFARGGHTEAWNGDRARYDRLVHAFLAKAA
ncbi:alpha/beta hydrolase family protein [Streptosporangium saharense]|uniref:alpha/beta hydrolase family protein n=1 Tax=Streptosporangium saharense TaxID=1706840 RepID=UPI00332DEF1F